jgi:hypothetical protein
MTAILRNYSRYAIGTIEILLGFFLAFNSVFPLLSSIKEGFDRLPGQSAIEYFLTGTGVGSSGFWVRLLATGVGLGMMAVPIFNDSERTLKIRSVLAFTAFMLFTYVGVLTMLFTDIIFFFWIAPLASGLISALVFLGNSAEVRNYARD